MTLDERHHKQALASIGCALCNHIYEGIEPGPVQLHHLRSGGWGKGDYMTLIPLCVHHHTGVAGIHTLGTKAWERHYGVTQASLLQWACETVKVR